MPFVQTLTEVVRFAATELALPVAAAALTTKYFAARTVGADVARTDRLVGYLSEDLRRWIADRNRRAGVRIGDGCAGSLDGCHTRRRAPSPARSTGKSFTSIATKPRGRSARSPSLVASRRTTPPAAPSPVGGACFGARARRREPRGILSRWRSGSSRRSFGSRRRTAACDARAPGRVDQFRTTRRVSFSASGSVRHGTPTWLQMPGIVSSQRVGRHPLKLRPSYVTTVKPRACASATTNGSAPSRRPGAREHLRR